MYRGKLKLVFIFVLLIGQRYVNIPTKHEEILVMNNKLRALSKVGYPDLLHLFKPFEKLRKASPVNI